MSGKDNQAGNCTRFKMKISRSNIQVRPGNVCM